MITTRSATITTRRRGTAITARDRLIQDKDPRRHKTGTAPRPPLAIPPITVTFRSLAAGLTLADDTFCLSPAEQKRRAIQIARSFKRHIMSELRYDDYSQSVVAVMKPAPTADGAPQASHRIRVDADGNINVCEEGVDCDNPASPHRSLLLTVCSVLTALGALACWLVF
jgi:hypothetical protein